MGPRHNAKVYSLAVTHGVLCAGCWDGTVKLWDHQAQQVTNTLSGHSGAIYALAAAEGQPLCSASMDGTMRLWDTRASSCVAVLTGHLNSVLAVVYADGVLCSGGGDCFLRMWDCRNAGGESQRSVLA